MPHRPRLQALLLADHVYKDQATGKFVLAGTFRQLWASQFPTHFSQRIHAFVSLTDLRGRSSIRLRYVDSADLAVLLETPPLEIECEDPLETLEFAVEIPGFPMPHPGAYTFELHADGDLLGSLRVTASPIQRPAGPDQPPADD